jgi:hypothetical protein
MDQSTILVKTIDGMQGIGTKSILQCLRAVLPFSNYAFSQIPKGKWKNFFSKKMHFGLGVSAEPFLVFLHQENRIAVLKKSTSHKAIIEKFMRRNFNQLIEVILYPIFLNCGKKVSPQETAVSVLVPKDFSFTDEEFASLQKAFAGLLQIQKKWFPTTEQGETGNVLFFEFSIWPDEESRL